MKIRIPQATITGYSEVGIYGCFDWSYTSSKTRRGRVHFVQRSAPESRRYMYSWVMRKREMGINYNGRFCPVWSTLHWNATPDFYRGGLQDLARSLKCDDSLAVVVLYED